MRTVTTGSGGGLRAPGWTARSAAAFALATTLLLTGCGGGSKDGATERAAPAPTLSASVAPLETGSALPRTERPDVTLPRDLTERYETWVTHDSERDLVMGDAGLAQGTVLDALVGGETTTGAVEFFFTGKALSAVRAYTRDSAASGSRPTGFVRYFKPELTLPDGLFDLPERPRAALSFCADESRLSPKNRVTGKVGPAPRGADALVFYETRLRLSDRGVWQTFELATERGAAECAP
ncbi:hypothetical protein [Streptomyces sp. NPDC059816]|uniref:hypothetical protein n=1 Tax=Streptomyces sp. NPDC059816 TaxID=3346960 RepID=UPI00365C69E2